MLWRRGAPQATPSLYNLTNPGRYANLHCRTCVVKHVCSSGAMWCRACMPQSQSNCRCPMHGLMLVSSWVQQVHACGCNVSSPIVEQSRSMAAHEPEVPTWFSCRASAGEHTQTAWQQHQSRNHLVLLFVLLHQGAGYDTIVLCQCNKAIMCICKLESVPRLSGNLLFMLPW